MTKFIQDLIDQFKARKTGMEKNVLLWTGQPVKVDDVDKYIKTLQDIDAEIETAKDTLQQKRTQSRTLADTKEKDLAQIDNLAVGLHKSNQEKLNEYDIKLRKPGEKKPVPGKAVIQSIADDVDGEGFIIRIAPLENMEHFEAERGVSSDPAAKVLPPPYPFLRTTKKSEFVDDAVEKGKRYFYRLRGVNSAGAGEWSEPVSRVQ